jgi:hypothetical protein
MNPNDCDLDSFLGVAGFFATTVSKTIFYYCSCLNEFQWLSWIASFVSIDEFIFVLLTFVMSTKDKKQFIFFTKLIYQ